MSDDSFDEAKQVAELQSRLNGLAKKVTAVLSGVDLQEPLISYPRQLSLLDREEFTTQLDDYLPEEAEIRGETTDGGGDIDNFFVNPLEVVNTALDNTSLQQKASGVLKGLQDGTIFFGILSSRKKFATQRGGSFSAEVDLGEPVDPYNPYRSREKYGVYFAVTDDFPDNFPLEGEEQRNILQEVNSTYITLLYQNLMDVKSIITPNLTGELSTKSHFDEPVDLYRFPVSNS